MKVQLAISIVQFLIQLLKWFDRAENRSVETKIKKFVEFKNALVSAQEGKPDALEKMFETMRP